MKIRGKDNILRGNIIVPGDKSISHRAIMLLSISDGRAELSNVLESEDVYRTIEVFRELGVHIEKKDRKVLIDGVGLRGLKVPGKELYCGNSGTTMRLMTGLLAGQNFDTVLTGDKSLNSRPMDRIVDPLSMMGAKIESRELKAPLKIYGAREIRGMDYKMKLASAQVKSAILLLGLYTSENLAIEELNISRNHTENMLRYLGVDLESKNGKITIRGHRHLEAKDIYIPGDISSAAYFIVAGTLLEGSDIVIKDVGINKSRAGIIDILRKMGGDIEILNKSFINNEEVADIRVRSSNLRSTTIEKAIIGSLVDEIPIIAVASAFADGLTRIIGLEELRVKETDRLSAIVNELKKSGVNIWIKDNDLYIKGGHSYRGSVFNSYNDHRMAMALSIFSLACEGVSDIKGAECVDISYPNFYRDLIMLLN